MYVPFFPLKLVAFPDEELNLHIFEPRYRQLIADIEIEGGVFGVCTFLDKISGFGTLVRLDQVYKRYEDGRLDIKTVGIQPFRINSFDNPSPGKEYAGGEIEFLPNDPTIDSFLNQEYIFYLKEMLFLLKYDIEVDSKSVNSYTFSHKIGLSLEEELELLKMVSEADRTKFLVNHFKRIIPAVKAAEQAKEKIAQNGHFKHLDPLNF
jgi:Lon protease-like protein